MVDSHKNPNPVDVHVGHRVRVRRTLLGLSQDKLGQAIGLTFQQVQKYERGSNRISASRLFDLARILDVSVGYFFDDIDEPSAAKGLAEPAEPFGPDPLTKRETLELVRAYYRIRDPHVRKCLFGTFKAIAAAQGQRS